jgi:predicted DNA-binding transcriptional regulator AlpA
MVRAQKKKLTRALTASMAPVMPAPHQAPLDDDPLRVVSEREAAKILNLSVDTLRRRVRDGSGPARIVLSERRVGYRRSALAAWLDQRTA